MNIFLIFVLSYIIFNFFYILLLINGESKLYFGLLGTLIYMNIYIFLPFILYLYLHIKLNRNFKIKFGFIYFTIVIFLLIIYIFTKNDYVYFLFLLLILLFTNNLIINLFKKK